MRLVDLTRTLDSHDYERLPEGARMSARCSYRGRVLLAQGAGADVMCQLFACERHHLPGGEGWGEERVSINSHIGTHVDAPLHYGSTCEGKPARTIEGIALDELYCDGLVLDLRELAKPGQASASTRSSSRSPATAARSRPAVRSCCAPAKNSTRWPTRLFDYPGMTRESTLFLASSAPRCSAPTRSAGIARLR